MARVPRGTARAARRRGGVDLARRAALGAHHVEGALLAPVVLVARVVLDRLLHRLREEGRHVGEAVTVAGGIGTGAGSGEAPNGETPTSAGPCASGAKPLPKSVSMSPARSSSKSRRCVASFATLAPGIATAPAGSEPPNGTGEEAANVSDGGRRRGESGRLALRTRGHARAEHRLSCDAAWCPPLV